MRGANGIFAEPKKRLRAFLFQYAQPPREFASLWRKKAVQKILFNYITILFPFFKFLMKRKHVETDEEERARNIAKSREYNNKRNSENRVLNGKDTSHGKTKTLETIISTFKRVIMGIDLDTSQGDPRDVPMEVQIQHWDDQAAKKIKPAFRTCMICMPNGDIVKSPRYNTMTNQGSTKTQKLVCKKTGLAKISATMMGRKQQNAIEGAAIRLLLTFINHHCPEMFAHWDFKPVFDGNVADFMAHHDSWAADEWMPIQIKSAQIQLGLPTSYSLLHGQYNNAINCIAVGIRNYITNEAPSSADDTAVSADCFIYEIFNVGVSANVIVSLRPTPGVKYGPMSADRRLECKDSVENRTVFTSQMLLEWEHWPNKLTERDILYDMEIVNAPGSESMKIEKRGFEAIANAVRLSGVKLSPVWRQNECVDYKLELSGKVVFVSGKTASVKNKNQQQRSFVLKVGPNKQFCDLVVASYAQNYQRVAVMASSEVYNTGKKGFTWNEKDLKKCVKIFDLDTEASAFVKYVFTFARV